MAAVAVDLLDRETPELLRLVVPGLGGYTGLSSNCHCTSCDGGEAEGDRLAIEKPWLLMGVCNWSEKSVSHFLPVSQLRIAPRARTALPRRRRLHSLSFFKEV